MGRIPHERAALGDVALGGEPVQGKRQPLAGEPCGAEHAVAGAIERMREFLGSGAQKRPRQLFIRRPDDRTRAVGQRQERQRTGCLLYTSRCV